MPHPHVHNYQGQLHFVVSDKTVAKVDPEEFFEAFMMKRAEIEIEIASYEAMHSDYNDVKLAIAKFFMKQLEEIIANGQPSTVV